MPLSKYSLMAKAKTKMEEFAAKFNRPWKELLAEEITKAALEQASVAGVGATPSEFEHLHLGEDSDTEPLVAQDGASDVEPIITGKVERRGLQELKDTVRLFSFSHFVGTRSYVETYIGIKKVST